MTWKQHNPIHVATHGCPQHLDELVAICLLRQWAESRAQTIDVTFLARGEIGERAPGFDVLIDIGQQFDAELGRFDHHQGTPDVANHSSAGLVFDTLYADDPRRAYLEPIIRHVDAIDVGGARFDGNAGPGDRGRSMVSVPALLKAAGGFQHDPTASRRCLGLVEPLVASWFRQANSYRNSAAVIAAAERVGQGIFLETDEPYGPALLEYVQRETDLKFIGFPAGPNRFHVVAIRDAQGHNRVVLPASLQGATFVHPNGFLAVFADRTQARTIVMLCPEHQASTMPCGSV